MAWDLRMLHEHEHLQVLGAAKPGLLEGKGESPYFETVNTGKIFLIKYF